MVNTKEEIIKGLNLMMEDIQAYLDSGRTLIAGAFHQNGQMCAYGVLMTASGKKWNTDCYEGYSMVDRYNGALADIDHLVTTNDAAGDNQRAPAILGYLRGRAEIVQRRRGLANSLTRRGLDGIQERGTCLITK